MPRSRRRWPWSKYYSFVIFLCCFTNRHHSHSQHHLHGRLLEQGPLPPVIDLISHNKRFLFFHFNVGYIQYQLGFFVSEHGSHHPEGAKFDASRHSLRGLDLDSTPPVPAFFFTPPHCPQTFTGIGTLLHSFLFHLPISLHPQQTNRTRTRGISMT